MNEEVLTMLGKILYDTRDWRQPNISFSPERVILSYGDMGDALVVDIFDLDGAVVLWGCGDGQSGPRWPLPDDVKKRLDLILTDAIDIEPPDPVSVGEEEPEDEPEYSIPCEISRYESGELDEDEIITLFQHLINTGIAWHLQGSYGRKAHELIRAGLITPTY
jgi:hypothetical protein